MDAELVVLNEQNVLYNRALNKCSELEASYRDPVLTLLMLGEQARDLLQQRTYTINGAEGTLERVFSVLESGETTPSQVSLPTQLQISLKQNKNLKCLMEGGPKSQGGPITFN